jgi:hypothetical protein
MATKKKAVAAPKREQDKKAIRLVEKTIKSLDKFIERVSLGTSRSNPSIRAAHGKQVKSLLLEMLRDEKSGWTDLPSKKDRKAAKKRQ